MSATVVDPNFYYQPMRPEVQSAVTKNATVIPSSQVPPQRTGLYGNVPQMSYRDAYTKSSKNQPRQLTTVVRPVYDDSGFRTENKGTPRKFAEAEIITNPLAKRHYFRSVSSLDISMEEDDTPKPTLLKEFGGSASSIDFSKSVGGNIRMILDQLRHGRSGKSVNNSTNSLSSLQNSDGSGSGSGILCNPKSKAKLEKTKPKKGSIRSRPSIFRKMRGNSTESDPSGICVEPDVVLNGESFDGDRVRRKIFAHYDTQSLLAKLLPSKDAHSLTSRRNTTTGASAANYTTRCVMPISSDSSNGDQLDEGDGRANQLLLSCPYFRNEISSKDCSPSISPSIASGYDVIQLRRPQGRCTNPAAFRPHQGSLVLEEDKLNQSGRCAHMVQPKFEHIDNGAFYYRKYFHGEEHANYFGIDDKLGPVAISLKKENISDPNSRTLYRIIVRTSELSVLRGAVLQDALPRLTKDGLKPKDIVECLAPEIQTSCLKLALAELKTEEQLLKLDEQAVTKHYKIGIMYCKAGQCTEEEMYNNEISGPAFDEFLDLIGQRVRVRSFDKYRGGLDNKSDSTGLYSLYATFHDMEIMFHVSTMLPYTPSNRQQLLRKRHIGNDIVTIVFQEPGALPFSPKTIRSHFQHVFIIVQVVNPNSDRTQYMVSISRSRDVPPFGPPLPVESILFKKSEDFVDFILTKVINAENAAHKSDKFVALATRTRQEYLKDLAHNYVSSTGMESGFGKIAMFSFAAKKKDRAVMSFLCDAKIRGALSWSIKAKDFDPFAMEPIDGKVILGISATFFVLLDPISGAILKIVPNSNIVAWKSQEESLTIYYHVGDAVQIICDNCDDWRDISERLKAVTPGIEVGDVALLRNSLGHLGFHTQFNGIITDVDQRSNAWKAGLRKGCVLLEICGRSVNLLDHETMADLLRHANPVTVTILPPLEGGFPRRGCNRPVCIKAPEHILSANYDNLSASIDSMEQPPALTHSITSRSTSSLVDGHVAFFLKSEGPQSTRPTVHPVNHPLKSYDQRAEPSLDDLEAESRWWVSQMAEESARLNRLNQLPPTINGHVLPGPGICTESESGAGELRPPFRSFERKLSPNSTLPLFDSGTDTWSSTTSRSSSHSQKESVRKPSNPSTRNHVRHKTDPGLQSPQSDTSVQPPVSRAAIRNSPNKSSLKKTQHRHSANLQEELLKLINPDLIVSDSMTAVVESTSASDYSRRAGEMVPQRKSQSVDTPTPPVSASKSMEAIPFVDQSREVEWNSLVTTAERAVKNTIAPCYQHTSSDGWSSSLSNGPDMSPPPVRTRSSSKKPISGEFQPDRYVPAERIQELENQITKLIHDLHREREDKLALQTEVFQLKYSNQRYQDDATLSLPTRDGSNY